MSPFSLFVWWLRRGQGWDNSPIIGRWRGRSQTPSQSRQIVHFTYHRQTTIKRICVFLNLILCLLLFMNEWWIYNFTIHNLNLVGLRGYWLSWGTGGAPESQNKNNFLHQNINQIRIFCTDLIKFKCWNVFWKDTDIIFISLYIILYCIILLIELWLQPS